MATQPPPQPEPTHLCSICRRSLTGAEAHSIKGNHYCANCLVAGAQLAGLAQSPDLANFTPGRAALFAVIPGIGAVYNRQYVKGVQHVAIFAALWVAAVEGSAAFVFAVISFYIFTIIDAYRSAQGIIRDRLTHQNSPSSETTGLNVPIWGGLLVLMGAILFLDNLRILRLDDIFEFAWPILLFVVPGAYLIWEFYKRPRKDSSSPAASVPFQEPLATSPPIRAESTVDLNEAESAPDGTQESQ